MASTTSGKGNVHRAMGMRAAALVMMLGMVAGCSGGDTAAPVSTVPPAAVSSVVGPAGDTVTGPDGVQVVIPAGALSADTTIGIARSSAGAPELGGLRMISSVYAITPHGTTFSESARVSIPFNPADVAPGTQPIVIKSQPGGTWTALVSDVVGGSLAADTSGLSFYAVGTCYTSRDVTVGGPDPLMYCPAAHRLKLRLQDGLGASLPVLRSPSGTPLPVMTITTPTTLNFNVEYVRPVGLNRDDLLSVWFFGAGFLPAQQPLTDSVVNNTPIQPIFVVIDPALVPLAGRPGGVVIRVKSWVSYTTDSFYPGCLCFKPASWTYEAEVPVRVIYTPPAFSIGGTVSGLTGSGLVLKNNGVDNLSVLVSGNFTFATPVSAYSVRVSTQPSNPTQVCRVQQGSGTANAPVTTVTVNCAAVSASGNALLNDTGITASQCYQAGRDVLVSCASLGATTLSSTQDGMRGRDADPATNGAVDGKLGFSFTKIDAAGQPLSASANDWNCVKDNVTGLMWEVKTVGGLRDWNTRYSNYDSTTQVIEANGVHVTQANIDAATNSVGFKNAVNVQRLCGATDWRMPTSLELSSLVDYGAEYPNPVIDSAWFPNTQIGSNNALYFTSSPFGVSSSLGVDFDGGSILSSDRDSGYVRLVRAAP